MRESPDCRPKSVRLKLAEQGMTKVILLAKAMGQNLGEKGVDVQRMIDAFGVGDFETLNMLRTHNAPTFSYSVVIDVYLNAVEAEGLFTPMS